LGVKRACPQHRQGNAVSSGATTEALAEALKIKEEALQRVITADRIRVKFGTIPLELAGKNAGAVGKSLESFVATPQGRFHCAS
jgi:hypothetical protein